MLGTPRKLLFPVYLQDDVLNRLHELAQEEPSFSEWPSQAVTTIKEAAEFAENSEMVFTEVKEKLYRSNSKLTSKFRVPKKKEDLKACPVNVTDRVMKLASTHSTSGTSTTASATSTKATSSATPTTTTPPAHGGSSSTTTPTSTTAEVAANKEPASELSVSSAAVPEVLMDIEEREYVPPDMEKLTGALKSMALELKNTVASYEETAKASNASVENSAKKAADAVSEIKETNARAVEVLASMKTAFQKHELCIKDMSEKIRKSADTAEKKMDNITINFETSVRKINATSEDIQEEADTLAACVEKLSQEQALIDRGQTVAVNQSHKTIGAIKKLRRSVNNMDKVRINHLHLSPHLHHNNM